MKKIKIIVFDFDGVLASSNQLKQDAYFAVLPAGDHFLVKKALKDQTIVQTRSEIFRSVLSAKGIFPKKLARETALLSSRYNQLVQEGIERMGLVPGASETLSKLSAKYALYINSSTPGYALTETVARLKIGHFFKGVFGRKNLETKKSEILKEIMLKEKVLGNEILMVGDSDSDFEAAEEAGCRFVGVANDFNAWEKKEFSLIKNIAEISSLL